MTILESSMDSYKTGGNIGGKKGTDKPTGEFELKKSLIFSLISLLFLMLPGSVFAHLNKAAILPVSDQMFTGGTQQIDISWNYILDEDEYPYSVSVIIDKERQDNHPPNEPHWVIGDELLLNVGYPYKSFKTKPLTPGLYLWRMEVAFRSTNPKLDKNHWDYSNGLMIFKILDQPKPALEAPTTRAPAPQKSVSKKKTKKQVVSAFHKKVCKNKKKHQIHCLKSKNIKKTKQNKRFHKKKCSIIK